MNIENYILPENDDSCLEAAIKESLRLSEEKEHSENQYKQVILNSMYSQFNYLSDIHLYTNKSTIATFYINSQICKFMIDTSLSNFSVIKDSSCKKLELIYDSNIRNNNLIPIDNLPEQISGFIPYIELSTNVNDNLSNISTSLYVVENIQLPENIDGVLNIQFLEAYEAEISIKKKIMRILDKYDVQLELISLDE